ncbi:hypothetical protein VNI00_010964 [Paramarasmius palmivorus]|uniref:Cytochrome P450 n=1 Tax=Paramarasmius palmivorus TaxID=297713 RepID=A0AAW0CHA1_9AGAR
MDNLFLLIPFGLVVIALTRHFTRSYKGSANYPPGPKPWPIIGNALDIPSARAWEVYSDWCRSYGQDLVHLQVLGQHIMIVNSREMARELFEKRSLIYADRPYVPMIELMGWADNGFGKNHNFLGHLKDLWLKPVQPSSHTAILGANIVDYFKRDFVTLTPLKSTCPFSPRRSRNFSTNLFNDPDSFRSHIRTLTGAIIMGIVYGHEVASSDDYFLDLAEKANETLLTVSTSSATVVNMFPFLRHFPGWLPGCKFQRIAREARNRIADMVEKPYSLVVDQLARSNTSSFAVINTLTERFFRTLVFTVVGTF